MTPQQEKKLKRLAKALDNKELGVLEIVDEVEAKLEQDIETIHAVVKEALAIAEQTKKLEGKKGDKGDPGINGRDGKDGVDGRDGVDGKDGLDGDTGPPGVPGEAGRDGKDGKDGEDGFIDEATIAYLEDELKRIDKKNGGYGQVIRKLRAGNNITIDETNMEYPTISVTPQITVSDTAPTSPALNDIWIDTNAYTYKEVSATYTITSTDYFLGCTGTFTITLPTAVNFSGEYIVKNVGTGVITVDTTSTETIDDALTETLIADEVITLRSDNSNWLIV